MTTDEKKKIYAALSSNFPAEAIERTDGRITGRGYSTTGIKYQYVVNRLNEVLGIGSYRAHRTVTVKEIQTAKGRPAFESICDLTLELGEWVNGEFICWAESLADGGHTSMSEADARKGAYTNAFKKAAAFFGVGKQAYEGSIDDDAVPADVALEEMRSSSVPPMAILPAHATQSTPTAPEQQNPAASGGSQTAGPSSPPPPTPFRTVPARPQPEQAHQQATRRPLGHRSQAGPRPEPVPPAGQTAGARAAGVPLSGGGQQAHRRDVGAAGQRARG